MTARYASPPQIPSAHSWTWESWVEHELAAGLITLGVTPSNAGRKALWAAYAHRLGRCDRVNVFEFIAESTAYWSGSAAAVGPDELSRAGRCAQILSPLSADELALVRAWYEAMLPRRAFERGPFNRAIADGFFLEMCATVEADGADLQDRADAHWSDWASVGDLAEDSGNYVPEALSRLAWWSVLRDEGSEVVAGLLDRFLQMLTPLGNYPHHGNDIGVAGNAGALFAAIGVVGDSAAFWAASRLFDFVALRRSDIEGSTWDSQYRQSVAEGLFELLLADAPDAAAPIRSTGATTRARPRRPDILTTGEITGTRWLLDDVQVPDKLVLRGQRSEVVVNLAPWCSHSHPEMGAVISYVQDGSLLLTGTRYEHLDPELHNQLSVRVDGDETPRLVHQHGLVSGNFTASGVVTVTFRARTISGSPYLTLRRSFAQTPGSNNEPCVRLTDTLTEYTIELDLIVAPPQGLTFSLATGIGADEVAGGVFELLDVVVTDDEDSQVFTWSPGEFEVVSATTPDRQSNVAVVEATNATPSLPYARVALVRHLQQPVDVVREYLLSTDALLVKDTVTVLRDFSGEIGPYWQADRMATDVANASESFDVTAQETLPIVAVGGSPLLEWTNTAVDLAVSVQPAPQARDFEAGEVLHFASLLVPHLPGRRAVETTPKIEWVNNEADLTIVRVGKRTLVLNGTGGSVEVDGESVSSRGASLLVGSGATTVTLVA